MSTMVREVATSPVSEQRCDLGWTQLPEYEASLFVTLEIAVVDGGEESGVPALRV